MGFIEPDTTLLAAELAAAADADLRPEHTRLLHLFVRLPVQDQREMLGRARLKIQLRELQSDELG